MRRESAACSTAPSAASSRARPVLLTPAEPRIWTFGVDPATTRISHNVFGPGVITPVSTN
jgi:hypothetical protein